MIEENFKITDLLYDDNSLVMNSNYIQIGDKDSWVRLYYTFPTEYDQFEFCCVSIISCCTGVDIWKSEETDYNILFKGSSYFDGVRHLYFGIEKDADYQGYIYCPNLKDIIKALQELEILETKYCPQK